MDDGLHEEGEEDGRRRGRGGTNCVPSGAEDVAGVSPSVRVVGGAHETATDKACGWSGQVVLQNSRPCGGKSWRALEAVWTR